MKNNEEEWVKLICENSWRYGIVKKFLKADWQFDIFYEMGDMIGKRDIEGYWRSLKESRSERLKKWESEGARNMEQMRLQERWSDLKETNRQPQLLCHAVLQEPVTADQ
jgi:hypothetical protein